MHGRRGVIGTGAAGGIDPGIVSLPVSAVILLLLWVVR